MTLLVGIGGYVGRHVRRVEFNYVVSWIKKSLLGTGY